MADRVLQSLVLGTNESMAADFVEFVSTWKRPQAEISRFEQKIRNWRGT